MIRIASGFMTACHALANRSGRIVMTCCLVVILVAAGMVPGQEALRAAGCYRFDRAYFDQLGVLPDSTGTQPDTIAVVQLDTAMTNPYETRLRLIPRFTLAEAPRRDAQGRLRSLGRSGYWRSLGRDSVEISWFSGFHGPLFRMEVRGDSLTGTVVMRTDILSRDPVTGRPAPPPEEPASAIRVLCPR